MRTAAPSSPPGTPGSTPTLAEAEAAEAALDIDGMVRAAVEGIERVQVNL